MLNISNHPSSKWSSAQLEAARSICWGQEVVDLPFPNVPASAESSEVWEMAAELATEANERLPDDCPRKVAMVQGEASLAFDLTRRLIAAGWIVVVACSERQVVEMGDGTKVARFEFVRFRTL